MKLKVSIYAPSYEHLKLTAKVPQRYQKELGVFNFDYVLLTSVSDPKVSCAAVVQYTDEILEDTIDLSEDLRDTLGIQRGNFVTIKAFKPTELSAADLVHSVQLKTPIRADSLFPYLVHKPLTLNGTVYYKGVKLTVISLKALPNEKPQFGVVTKNTVLSTMDVISYNPVASYSQLGGLQKELAMIRDVIQLPFSYGDLFNKLRIKPPKGILLYGPPGVGKTSLGRAIAKATNANFFLINAPEIAEKYYGDSEAKLRAVFEKATSTNRQAVIFIDQADVIASNRATANNETDQRIVAQLLVLIDGLQKKQKAVVIFATNLPDKIDPAFRRGGRLDVQIALKPPTLSARKDIFRVLLRDTPKVNIDLDYLAKATNGYVGADISALIKQAGISCVKEYIKESVGSKLMLTMDHFHKALKLVEPSILREHKVVKTKTRLSDVIGLDAEVAKIKQSVLYPIKYGKLYAKAHLESVRGILLYGPPGTGKTLLAKALANQLGYKLITVNGPQLLNKYVGQTEAAVRSIFRKARYAAPTMIILDQIDSLVGGRGDMVMSNSPQILGQFLVQLNGLHDTHSVILVCTSNRPDLLDKALLRAGRFDLKMHIGTPKIPALTQLIRYYGARANVNLSESFVDALAIRAYGMHMTGADIVGVYKEALRFAIEQLEAGTVTTVEIKEAHVERAFNGFIDDLSTIYKDQKTSYGDVL